MRQDTRCVESCIWCCPCFCLFTLCMSCCILQSCHGELKKKNRWTQEWSTPSQIFLLISGACWETRAPFQLEQGQYSTYGFPDKGEDSGRRTHGEQRGNQSQGRMSQPKNQATPQIIHRAPMWGELWDDQAWSVCECIYIYIYIYSCSSVCLHHSLRNNLCLKLVFLIQAVFTYHLSHIYVHSY